MICSRFPEGQRCLVLDKLSRLNAVLIAGAEGDHDVQTPVDIDDEANPKIRKLTSKRKCGLTSSSVAAVVDRGTALVKTQR